MVNDAKDRETDAAGDANGERVEDCGGEDDEDQKELGPAADVEEEAQVVWGFFDERISYYGDHGGKDAFLWRSQYLGMVRGS